MAKENDIMTLIGQAGNHLGLLLADISAKQISDDRKNYDALSPFKKLCLHIEEYLSAKKRADALYRNSRSEPRKKKKGDTKRIRRMAASPFQNAKRHRNFSFCKKRDDAGRSACVLDGYLFVIF